MKDFKYRFYKTQVYPKHEMFILGLIEFFDSLIKILTLGFFGSNQSFFYVTYISRKELDKRIKGKIYEVY